MRKAYTLGFIAGLALLIVAGVGGFQLLQKDAEEETYRAEIVDATPAKQGMLSQKQRVHSNLYPRYKQLRGNETISEAIAEAKGHTRIITILVAPGLWPSPIKPETPENYFGELARASDAVIRGRVTKKESYITEDDGFVLTDYEVEVTEVLKNNTTPLDSGVTITLTRPGGKVVVDGMIVIVNESDFPPLPKNNHDLMLFLQFIPETGSYKPTRHTGTFELDGRTIRPLTAGSFPPGVIKDTDSFLQTTRAVSKQ